MQKIAVVLLIIVGALAAFAGYCMALIDWIQDFSTGVYATNHTELVVDTVAILIYTYLGIRFFNRNLGTFL